VARGWAASVGADEARDRGAVTDSVIDGPAEGSSCRW
jgi:hypothetical protein